MKVETDTHTIEFFPGSSPDGPYVEDPPYVSVYPRWGDKIAVPRPLTAKDELAIRQGPNNSMKIVIGNEALGSVESEDVNNLADLASQWRMGLSALEAQGRSTSVSSTPSSKSMFIDLSKHRTEILVERNMRIRVMSWNVRGEPIGNEDLAKLVGLPIMSDIYVLGLQESDPLAKNLYANTGTLENTKIALLYVLGRDYEIVAHNQLLGLLMVVAVSKSLKQHILPDIQIMSTGTGVFGVWGNKGAIYIRLTIGQDPLIASSGTDLVFVNCHLSAIDGEPGNERRQWELREIGKKFQIEGSISDSVIFDRDATELDIPFGASPNRTRRQSLINSKEIILFGDLNYRTFHLNPSIASDFVAKGDYETLTDHDSLQSQMKEHKVLNGYSEGHISFPPTFKYQSTKYDNRKVSDNDSEALDLGRVPSYTDRILFCGNMLSNSGYFSYPEYTLSDHKPVAGDFDLSVDLVDMEVRKRIVDQALRDHDFAENSSRPAVTVEPRELDVKAELLKPLATEIVLRHTDNGPHQRTVKWSVVLSSAHMTVEPNGGDLPVGAIQRIRFRTSFTLDRQEIDDVAIIRIEDGQDLFIPLHFESLPSCIGASLDLLCRMPNGVRNGMVKEGEHLNSTNMPKEIWNCVDYLWNRTRKDMFWKEGFPSIREQVQSWMDNGVEFDAHVLDTANEADDGVGIFSVAQQLLLLLRNLQGGIVPVEYFYMVLRGSDGMNAILESLNGVHVNVLIYLCSFIKKAIGDGVPKRDLLELFEPVLVSEPLTKLSSKARIKKREFLLAFVDN